MTRNSQPQTVTIRNLSQPEIPPLEAKYCASFLCRLRGLTFTKQLPPHWGLLLVQGRESRTDASIHMMGMWIDLCIVWINHDKRVVDVRLARKWRSFIIPAQPAQYVLETSVAYLDHYQIGHELTF